MIFESTIQYLVTDSKGNNKTQKDRFIHDGAGSFGEVEKCLYEQFGELPEFDVCAIKRSNLKEVANKREDEEQRLWIAEVADTTINDEGEEVEVMYKIAFYSTTFDSARVYITNYLKQDYNMSVTALKRTNFIDVIE